MLEHGGRLARAAREFAIPREAWLDLSTGVSPRAWPVPLVPADAWQRLPEDDDGLLDAARAYYGTRHLLPVAGSQAAIAALPRLRARSRVGVIAPGYAEHAHAWRQAGHDVVPLPLPELLARASEFDVVIVIRPNNPTGACLDRDALLDLHTVLVGAASAAIPRQRVSSSQALIAAEAAPTKAGPVAGSVAGPMAGNDPWLVVDEAFIDTRPDDSLVPHVRDGIIVLRSVGKFFGMAGARAGFIAAWPGLLDALAEVLGPWTLTGPSRYAVTQALMDRAWQVSARAWLHEASARLWTMLTKHGLRPSRGCEFFQYCERSDAAELQRSLARHAVLVRYFDAPRAVRFGLPADDAAFARLDRVLAEVMR
ncbi:cobalamin biosynthetic protein CobC [Luteibacter jiangsuensis]|uniref:Aminotransferase n=1 Tax=Luteibacter jiangsuensis TaxID=637577 RepID=A0ABT9SX71_9GAMM|nr:threonine-phosphate decarboxylase [Luteibacter jiangsuensis]MDQ0009586.1 cobalamin biosynthetic protein CobC [Luteibacter jiangsuensis]